ncbi:hypothetical protein ACFZB9_31565 [Kitasatospora sp. NPDC008050]|uniref:hypothetical protein n=1 Tax=Kitasatospora sp. NPDC008050 TaxID=3364021 RepID=UPI0036E8322C
MNMHDALHATLTRAFTSPFGDSHVPYTGVFHAAGELVVATPNICLSALDTSEFLHFDEIPAGRHPVYAAVDDRIEAPDECDEEYGPRVTAVAVVAAGVTAEQVAAASCESDGFAHLDPWSGVFALTGVERRDITLGEAAAEDYADYAEPRIRGLVASGQTVPVLDELIDPATGANALVFLAAHAATCNGYVGRDEEGTVVCLIWAEFD